MDIKTRSSIANNPDRSTINQVLCSLAQATITFHASLSLVAFSASAARPTVCHFVSPFSIFSRCFSLLHFPSIIPGFTRFSRFSLLITRQEKVFCRLRILFMSDLVSATYNNVSFDFFSDHKIRSILRKNQISFASSFLCKIV